MSRITQTWLLLWLNDDTTLLGNIATFLFQFQVHNFPEFLHTFYVIVQKVFCHSTCVTDSTLVFHSSDPSPSDPEPPTNFCLIGNGVCCTIQHLEINRNLTKQHCTKPKFCHAKQGNQCYSNTFWKIFLTI